MFYSQSSSSFSLFPPLPYSFLFLPILIHSHLHFGRSEFLNHSMWRGGRGGGRGWDVWWYWWPWLPKFWFPAQTHYLAWESRTKTALRGERRRRYLRSLTRWETSSSNYLPRASETLDLVEEYNSGNSRGSQISKGEHVGKLQWLEALPCSGSKMNWPGRVFHPNHMK